MKLYITVSRWEFLPAVLVGILIGIFLGAESFQYLLSSGFVITLIEGIIIFLLLFNVGFMVNCWADWKVDELYKTKLYMAVKKMGRSNLGVLVVIHIAVSILLAGHLTMAIGRIEISVLVWIGIFLGVAYSVEPFRFKRRGILHSLIAIPIFFIPGLYSYFLVSDLPLDAPYTYLFFLLAAGITVGHYALILVSQAEDFPVDKKMGLYTPAVKWGLKKTLYISFISNFLGSIVITIAFMLMFLRINIWLIALLPLIIVGRYLSMRTVISLYRISLDTSSNSALLEEIRKKMPKYPMWHAYGLTGITISSLMILVFKSLG
jgi:4-hydroxybenzoate polyprenyltransferase